MLRAEVTRLANLVFVLFYQAGKIPRDTKYVEGLVMVIYTRVQLSPPPLRLAEVSKRRRRTTKI